MMLTTTFKLIQNSFKDITLKSQQLTVLQYTFPVNVFQTWSFYLLQQHVWMKNSLCVNFSWRVLIYFLGGGGGGGYTFCCCMHIPPMAPKMGTAEAEMKVPSVEKLELCRLLSLKTETGQNTAVSASYSAITFDSFSHIPPSTHPLQ